jgi:hypothetical protein
MTTPTLAEALREIERLKVRGAAYEEAYGIAHRATYQSHSGHWDKTGQRGAGCPECIRAREARENCDAALKRGLEAMVELAAAHDAHSAPAVTTVQAVPGAKP